LCLIDRICEKLKKANSNKPKCAESSEQSGISLIKHDAYQKGLSALTITEHKVFMLLREGFSVSECSQRLNMKRRAVNRHVDGIYYKLNVTTTAELIVKYREKDETCSLKSKP
jgi:DNA-binding CsgD family transcriptional regulator